MPLGHLTAIPHTWLIAHRLHRQRRPSLARRAVLAVLRAAMPCDGCEHPS